MNALKTRLSLFLSVPLLVLFTLVAGAAFTAPALAQSSGHKVHVIKMEMNTKNYTFVFDPQTVTVNLGDTVKWVNDGMYQHNAVSTDHTTFKSPILNPKGSWSYTATKKGTFPYICTLHPTMKGTLIVK